MAMRLGWTLSPDDVIERWPAELPMAALVSGGGGALGRWTIFGIADAWRSVGGDLRDRAARRREWRAITAPRADRPADTSLPFTSGWIGFLSYELGALFEPSALRSGRSLDAMPLAGGWCCRAAIVHDGESDEWWWTGGRGLEPPTLEPPTVLGAAADIDALAPERSRSEYRRMVVQVRELIHAGDLFQANVARRWRARFSGSRRRLAAAALRASGARYGAVIECPDGGAVISMSPELFLRVDAHGSVVTRPIKGTLDGDRPRGELERSAKDAAELAMIVDLMRNDLARVCRPGSVRVVTPRTIESHPTVHHGVAEVRGALAAGADRFDLVAATFPPGSVTGAPKIRAMQVIEALETAPRGPYCGAVGFLADDGPLELNVAIRTITMLPPERGGVDASCDRTLLYSAGCGIVSDSDPDLECAESDLKCRVLERTKDALDAQHAIR